MWLSTRLIQTRNLAVTTVVSWLIISLYVNSTTLSVFIKECKCSFAGYLAQKMISNKVSQKQLYKFWDSKRYMYSKMAMNKSVGWLVKSCLMPYTWVFHTLKYIISLKGNKTYVWSLRRLKSLYCYTVFQTGPWFLQSHLNHHTIYLTRGAWHNLIWILLRCQALGVNHLSLSVKPSAGFGDMFKSNLCGILLPPICKLNNVNMKHNLICMST